MASAIDFFNSNMKKSGDLFLLMSGNVLCAIAIGMVALPLSISLGGTSGLAKVLNGVIPIRLSVWVMALNIILFSMAYFLVGKKFAMKTLFSAIVFPILLEVFSRFTWMSVLGNDLFLGSILAGALLGTGGGLILRGNGSCGGLDIIAIILNNRFGIPTAFLVGLFDCVVMLLQFEMSHALSFIYGIVLIFTCSMTMNRIVVAQKHEVKMMIFSQKHEEIRQKLLHQEDCGCSLLHGESGYERNPFSVIVSVVPYEKVRSCKETILETDANAFIVLEDVQAAYSGNYHLRRPDDMKRD